MNSEKIYEGTQRYEEVMAAVRSLIGAVQEIGREHHVCPWCLLFNATQAVQGGLHVGDIEHEHHEPETSVN